MTNIAIVPAKSSVWSWMVKASAWKVLAFHALLGVGIIIFPPLIIGWVYFLLFVFFTVSAQKRRSILPLLLFYLLPMELLGRMANASPFLPWELNKYLGMLLLIYGIRSTPSLGKGKVAYLMLVLSLPAVIITIFSPNGGWSDIAFNYLGLFNLILAILYFSNLRVIGDHIIYWLKVLLYGCSSVLAYVFFKTPDLEKVDFALGANFSVTGGFGSNQVSTILGLGFGAALFLWYMRAKIFKNDAILLFLFAAFFIWSLLSFSRGGVLSSFIALVLAFLFSGSKPYPLRKIRLSFLIPLVLVVGITIFAANAITGGSLAQRYAGETSGTLAGAKEKDLSQLTTGRWDILLSDIQIWQDNFVFGAGVGLSPSERTGSLHTVASHVEVSRMLSEHGLLGFFLVLLFILIPVVRYLKSKNNLQSALLIFAFSLAVATSFHSAMRTFVTPLFYGLGFVMIQSSRSNGKS